MREIVITQEKGSGAKMDYKIISDGCCDLTEDVIRQYDFHIVPFYISFDEEHYYKEIEDIGIRDVYQRMVIDQPDVYPKTSLPSLQDYISVFTSYVDQGMAVICLCFTPSLSGSYICAENAREIVCEQNPDAKISVINSEAGTVSQALMTIEAGKMRQAGIPYEQCVDILERMKLTNHIFFTVGDTDYLQHGGRIGKLAGIASSALSLKPLITLERGVIEASGIGRSRKKTVKKTMELAENYFKNTGEDMRDYYFAVGFGFDVEEGHAFYEAVKERFADRVCGDIKLVQIGATIAVHTGPFAIGIGILKRYECFL